MLPWLLGLPLAVAVFVLAYRLEAPYQRWLLRRGHNRVGRTMVCSLAVHLGLALLWFAGAVIVIGVAGGDPRGADWAGLVIPMILLHGPFAVLYFPTPYGGWSESRRSFEQLGARPAVARAAYWSGGWLGFLALLLMAAAYVRLFTGPT